MIFPCNNGSYTFKNELQLEYSSSRNCQSSCPNLIRGQSTNWNIIGADIFLGLG